MTKISIKGIIVGEQALESESVVEVESGLIAGIYAAEQYTGAIDYDFTGHYVGPGFIDLHFHGAMGAGFMEAGDDAYAKMLKHCAAHGTTGILAGISTAPLPDMDAALDGVARFMRKPSAFSKILGVHLEGPFINTGKPGAMDPKNALIPSVEQYKRWEVTNVVKMITLAPEIEGAKEVITYAASRGAVVSAGHTLADYGQINEAAAWGLNHLTHFYNAMTGLNHREPGAAGAGLFNAGITIELISDYIHVHPKMLELAWRVKGAGGICLVTDSVEFAGLPSGEYISKHGEKRVVSGNKITTGGDTIAGSAHTLDAAVRNMHACGVPLWEAWQMASVNPAAKLGLQNELGTLDVGMRADIAVLNKELACAAAFVDGKPVELK